jgi:hypothetical protein
MGSRAFEGMLTASCMHACHLVYYAGPLHTPPPFLPSGRAGEQGTQRQTAAFHDVGRGVCDKGEMYESLRLYQVSGVLSV